MSEFNEYAKFVTTESHRENFKSGNLVEIWSRIYPCLFDDKDLQIALNQRHLGYHYYEWFAAILLYHTKGLLSLVEGYAYRSHKRKWGIIETLVDEKTSNFLSRSGVSSATQCPDLLVYSADRSNWFFCEVKGPKDRLHQKQIDFFHELGCVTGKKIQIVNFINPAIH